MSLILSLTIASAVGTLLGNMVLFWLIGAMAKRQEKKQMEELQKLQQGYLEMAQRERARLENYARMEG
jgi:flagellar motor component MotA